MQVTISLAQSIVDNSASGATSKTAAIHNAKKKLKAFVVSGMVKQTSSYCGGARPSQAMLDRLSTPAPYPYKKFYIKRGNINCTEAKVVTGFTTDSTGKFSFRLKPGTYAIILEEQLYPIDSNKYENENEQVDRQCLVEWWAKPYYLLVVKNKNINELKFIFHHRCFVKTDIPCITYKGPLPP